MIEHIEHEIRVIKSFRAITMGLKNKKFFNHCWNKDRSQKAIELNLLRRLKNKAKRG